MKNYIYLFVLFLIVTNCSFFSNKPLQLNGPTVEEAAQINSTSKTYLDGVYVTSQVKTGLSHKLEYGEKTHYHIAYKPVIVARDFKQLKSAVGIAGNPVIDFELHTEAHDRFYKATQNASENKPSSTFFCY